MSLLDLLFGTTPLPLTYIITRKNDVIKARNGITGDIDHDGNDAANVIQAAIDSCPDTGGSVYISNDGQEYTLSDSIKNSGKRIIIDSNFAMFASPEGKYAFEFTGLNLPNINSAIKNVVIYGKGKGNGIRIYDAHKISLENLYISSPITGIALEKENYWIEDCEVRGVRIYNPNAAAIKIGREAETDYVSYTHNSYENIKIDLHTESSANAHAIKVMPKYNLTGSSFENVHVWFKTGAQNSRGFFFGEDGYLQNVLLRNVSFERQDNTLEGIAGVEFTHHFNGPTVIPKFSFINFGDNTRVLNPNAQSYIEVGI